MCMRMGHDHQNRFYPHLRRLEEPLKDSLVNMVEDGFPEGSTRHTPSLWETTAIGSEHSTGFLRRHTINMNNA